LEIYYQSIGQNSSLLINFPVDTRGLIPDSDVQAILELAAKVKEDFAVNLVSGAKVSASSSRGASYAASQVLDGNYDSYWAAAAGQTRATVELDFGKQQSFNRILIQEYVNLGQRVSPLRWKKKWRGNGCLWRRVRLSAIPVFCGSRIPGLRRFGSTFWKQRENR
ncbi:MAG: discoidin domain-containing protein, partial [Bacteroidota bacterium]